MPWVVAGINKPPAPRPDTVPNPSIDPIAQLSVPVREWLAESPWMFSDEEMAAAARRAWATFATQVPVMDETMVLGCVTTRMRQLFSDRMPDPGFVLDRDGRAIGAVPLNNIQLMLAERESRFAVAFPGPPAETWDRIWLVPHRDLPPLSDKMLADLVGVVDGGGTVGVLAATDDLLRVACERVTRIVGWVSRA